MTRINDFEEYKKFDEPNKLKRAENWRVAIGLQQVDGLTPSKYLIENALVRANYNNLEKSIYETMGFLHKFFGNLLLGEKNTLENRDLQVGAGSFTKYPENTRKAPRKF